MTDNLGKPACGAGASRPRWFIKRPHRSAAAARASILAAQRWVPSAPAATQVSKIDAGGVAGDLIATPASRPDRHVLYLRGGAGRQHRGVAA
jgi:hypothetical protein